MGLARLFYAKNLSRQCNRGQRPRPRRYKSFPRRRPFFFEPLEPRLLLSADQTILGLVVDPSPSLAPVASPPVVVSLNSTGLDPAVNIPTTLSGAPGGTVTVPVSIDNAAGLESADLQIAYDSAKLDLLAVRAGTVTGGATLLTSPIDPTTAAGALTVGLALTTPHGPGSGSLLEMDLRIKPNAPGGPTSLDLKSVSLNEGGLVVTPTPVAGLDQTDGVITILSGNSPPVAANGAFTVAEDQVLNVAAPAFWRTTPTPMRIR